MYTTMFGMASFIDWRGGLKTIQGIFWFAVGGFIGWPFSAALILPFLLEEVIFAVLASQEAVTELFGRVMWGCLPAGVVLVS